MPPGGLENPDVPGHDIHPVRIAVICRHVLLSSKVAESEVAESSILIISNSPDLPNRISICQPNLPFLFLTSTHSHSHRPMNHLPFNPLSAAQMDLFQPVWQ